MAVYVAARLFRLDNSCLWFDEVFTVHAAEHSWGEILNFLALDLIHPPLFYLLLKVWMAIGGDGIFWLRLLPVLISIGAIIPFLKLCRELRLNRLATVLAFFLLATNGALIKYAQEVRMYSLLMCLSLSSMWLFVRFVKRGKGLAVLVLVNLLLVYTHYFGWFVIASEILVAATLYRASLKRIFYTNAAIFIAFAPWLIAVLKASQHGSDVQQNIGWMSRPGIVEILQFALDLVEPFYQQSTSADAGSIYLISIPLLIVFIAVMAAGFLLSSRGALTSPDVGTKTPLDMQPAIKLLVLFIIVPIALAFLASWLAPVSVWGTRHLIIVFAPLALLVGIGISSLNQGNTGAAFNLSKLQTIVAAGIVILTVAAFIVNATREQQTYSWCEVDAESRQIAVSGQPLNFIAIDELIAYHLWFATRKDSNATVKLIKNLPGTRDDAAYFIPRGFSGIRVADASNTNADQILDINGDAVREASHFFLRSSTLIDHRRNREAFVTEDSLPIQYLKQSGIVLENTKNIPAGSEDVYSFRLGHSAR